MIRRSRIVFAVALLLLSCAFVSPAHADEVDQIVLTQMQKRHIPGAAVAVIRNGKIIKVKGYGLANVELNVPVTTSTVFEIGSVTKQFTASAIMMLVQEGKIALDDSISKYLEGLPEAWSAVTVHHLLTHTSGVKNYTGLSGFEWSKHLKNDEFIKAVSGFPLDFQPGARWSYSNTGYNLLGMIVEKASGKPYWQFMSERIFKPLGMNATRDRDPHIIIPNRADGYEWENGALEIRDGNLTELFSAGATVSTILDLAKWDAALNTEIFLKRSSLEKMWSPVRFNDGTTYTYGFGWNTDVFRGHRIIRHGGQTAGFSSSFNRYVDDHLTVLALCNLGDIGVAGILARVVAKVYIPALSLSTLKAATDADPQQTRMLRNVIAERMAGRADENLFTPDARRALFTAEAKTAWAKFASYGALDSFILLENERQEKLRIRRYRMLVGRRTLDATFALTDGGQIAEMKVEDESE